MEGGFKYPSRPVDKASEPIDSKPTSFNVTWPQPHEPIVFNRGFALPSSDKPVDTSSFQSGMSMPSGGQGGFKGLGEPIRSDAAFHTAIASVMHRGEMASRTTISEEAATDHDYTGPIQGVRYG